MPLYGVRFKAEIANDVFLKQLKSLIPKKGMIDVFIEDSLKILTHKRKLKTQKNKYIKSNCRIKQP